MNSLYCCNRVEPLCVCMQVTCYGPGCVKMNHYKLRNMSYATGFVIHVCVCRECHCLIEPGSVYICNVKHLFILQLASQDRGNRQSIHVAPG